MEQRIHTRSVRSYNISPAVARKQDSVNVCGEFDAVWKPNNLGHKQYSEIVVADNTIYKNLKIHQQKN